MRKSLKTHASTKDNVASLLYANQTEESRFFLEVSAVNQVEALWLRLKAGLESGRISQNQAAEMLGRLDLWLKHRLSGAQMQRLLQSIEVKYPEFIRHMPESMASRYEEIKVARLWSSLFDPEALIRLSSSIEVEKNLSGEFPL